MSEFSLSSPHHNYSKKEQDCFDNFQTRNYTENLICNVNLVSKSLENALNPENNIQLYQFNDHEENSETSYSIESEEHETINEHSTITSDHDRNKKKFNSHSVVVPTLSNVNDIFELLSQKIAKYCQVLADLTNCEVFYKAQLPMRPDKKQIPKNSKSKDNLENNTYVRSLYWGTHQMLFEYSHNHGLKYNKAMGDCLIKINNRSLTNDVSNLIEEILNEPNVNFNNRKPEKNDSIDENINENLFDSEIIENNQECKNGLDYSNQDIEIKDCIIKLNRLDDTIFNQYLNNFESYNNRINKNTKRHKYEFDLGVSDDSELYSDKNRLSLEKINNKNENVTKANFLNDSSILIESNNEIFEENEDEDESEDLDEKSLLIKNCFDYNQNEEEYYNCEYCKNHFFKHLTQLKIHELRVHQNVFVPDENEKCSYKCSKCNLSLINRIEYLKHIILCYYPDIYSCKTCKLSFTNYSQYLFHSKFVHTNVVYMCSICGRKYREIKDLLDHDHLMHSKSYIYCEICCEQQRSRKKLFEHYKIYHLNENENNLEVFETINHARIKYSDNQVNQVNFNGNLVTESINKKENYEKCKQAIFPLDDKEKNLIILNSNKSSLDIDQNLNQSNTNKWNKIQKNDLIRGLIDRKHQCKWCSLRFYTKSQLKQHETTHTNSVLYCPVCDKEFTHKDRLSGHMKCHMEPSLECKVCGKKFKRLCNLYNHELVHGLTEHAFMLCQFCGRGFRSRRDYQNHVIANHRDQIMKSDTLELNRAEYCSTISFKEQHKKNGKRLIKSLKLDNSINQINQIERTISANRTTTIMLSDEYTNLSIENEATTQKNKNEGMNEYLESETYFTRTNISKNMIEIEQENEIEVDERSEEKNDNLYNQYIDSNGRKSNMKYNLTPHFKNKKKRLKVSLDVEVFDDNNHDIQNNNNNLSCFSEKPVT